MVFMERLVYSPKSLGSIIKEQRKKKKLSQKLVGSGAVKIEQSTISSIEQGAPGTRLETVFRILAALNLEMVIRPKMKTRHKIKWEW